jgi:hypothetical protein
VGFVVTTVLFTGWVVVGGIHALGHAAAGRLLGVPVRLRLGLGGEWRDARAAAAQTGVIVPDAPEVRAVLTRMRGRAFWQRGIDRQPEWAALVDTAVAEAGMPRLIAAVPLVASGYSNWGASRAAGGADEAESAAPGVPGRGLWMFIAPTARTYGLRVEDTVDERLDPVRETAAAIAYLNHLHQRYGDWNLALAAYNQGERAVDAALATGGTRDVWALQSAGLLNDYVAQVHAAALVLASPGLLEG